MSGVFAFMRRAAKELIISKYKTLTELSLQTTVFVRAPPKWLFCIRIFKTYFLVSSRFWAQSLCRSVVALSNILLSYNKAETEPSRRVLYISN